MAAMFFSASRLGRATSVLRTPVRPRATSVLRTPVQLRASLAAVCLGLFTPVLLSPLGASTEAFAQPKSVPDEARELARDGWAAQDAGKFAEALDKVTKAEALYHAPTHLLLMGNAQIGLGKLADALDTFERLSAEPLPAASPPAFKDAQDTGKKRMKELLARVPSLLVVVESTDAPAYVVTVDGKKVDFASGVAARFDPGPRQIKVVAEGFTEVTKTVTLPEKGGVVRIAIVLEKPRPPGAETTGKGGASGSAAPTATASPTATALPVEASRVPVYIAFGVAGASAIVGAITGGLSIAKTTDLKARCPNDRCSESDRSELDSANTLAHVSTATFVLGGVAAVAGVVLVAVNVSGPSKQGATGQQKQSVIRLSTSISPGGLSVRGTF